MLEPTKIRRWEWWQGWNIWGDIHDDDDNDYLTMMIMLRRWNENHDEDGDYDDQNN